MSLLFGFYLSLFCVSEPGPPKNVFCNVSKNAHTAKVAWLPPEYPRGLITKYVIRYKHLARKVNTEWKNAVVVMEPNSKGYPLFHNLDADYYKKYRIEVYAVNSAGGGQSAVIESCALRKATTGRVVINLYYFFETLLSNFCKEESHNGQLGSSGITGTCAP